MNKSSSPQGLLLIDKPGGITSHDAVARTRRWYGTRKVGHAGTLDPMATGLLVLGLGQGTKLLTYIIGADKTYTATIRLGSSTPSDDADSKPDRVAEPAALAAVDDTSIATAVLKQTGDIVQVPSAVSAIKIDGKKAYELVRSGEDVKLKARAVTVSRFDVHDIRRGVGFIDVDVSVDCSSGTYIRALARDIGQHLGVYGHLTALRRTRVGTFSIESANELPSREALSDRSVPAPELMSLASAAGSFLPTHEAELSTARKLLQGQFVQLGDAGQSPTAVTCAGQLVAIAEPTRDLWKTAVGMMALEQLNGL